MLPKVHRFLNVKEYSCKKQKVKLLSILTLVIFCSGLVFGQYTPAMPATQSGTNLSNPFGGPNAYSDLRHQYILLASDLTAGGMVANDVLKSIGISVSGGSSKTYGGLTISLKHTTASTLSTYDGTGLSIVYQGSPFVNNTAGWKDFSFSNPFVWNGTNNILVSICWNNVSTSAGLLSSFYATGSNRAYFHQATSGTGCNLTGTNVSQNVPRTRFGIQPKITSFTPASVCPSSNQTVTITGKYFTGTSSVTIGGTSATSFIVNSDTQITATIGSGTTGPISVTTLQGTGTSASSITVNSSPTIYYSNSPYVFCLNSPIIPVSPITSGSPDSFTVSPALPAGLIMDAATGVISGTPNTYTLSANTYTVTATNANFCTGTTSISINVNNYPATPIISTTFPTCSASGTATVTNYQPSYNYLFSPSGPLIGASGIVSGLQPQTNYSVSAINQTNCQSFNSVNFSIEPHLYVPDIPIVDTLTSSCITSGSGWIVNYMDSLVYTFSPLGPISDSEGQIVGFIPDVQYTLVASGIFCSSAQSIPFVIDSQLTVPSNPNDLNSNVLNCDSILISFSTSPPDGVSWYWQGEDSIGTSVILGSDSLIYVSNSGVYYLRALSSDGCWSNSSTGIQVYGGRPEANIISMGPVIFCEGDTSILQANTGDSLNYTWVLNNAEIAGEHDGSLMVSSSGCYQLQVINNYNCNAYSDTICILVNSTPEIPIVESNSLTTFCQGDSVVLSVSNDPSLSYQWQNNGSNILNGTFGQLTVYDSGNYSISVMNADNCSSGSIGQNVTVYPLPSSEISALSNATFCEGDSVVLQGSSIANGIYSWSNQNGIISNSDASSVVVFDSGSYSYQIIDSNNCSNQSETIDIIVNTHNPSEIYTTSLGPYSLNGTTYSESGVYLQNIQTVSGCDSVLTLNLVVQDLGFDLLAVSNDQNFLIYPNPVRGNKIFFQTSPTVYIEVLDVTNTFGQKIDFELHDQMIELMPNTKSGIYFIHVLSDKRSIFYPVVLNE